MKTKITYAAIFGLIGIASQLISFLLGFQTDKIGTPAATIFGMVIWFVSLVLGFVVVWLGLRAVRDEKPDQCLTYGQGVGAGVIIVLIAAVISAVYLIIHLALINPGFVENTLAVTREKWAAMGMPDEQMQMAEKIMRVTMHPAIMALMGFFWNMVIGTIISLIAAAIVKRNPQPQFAAQVPPAL